MLPAKSSCPALMPLFSRVQTNWKLNLALTQRCSHVENRAAVSLDCVDGNNNVLLRVFRRYFGLTSSLWVQEVRKEAAWSQGRNLGCDSTTEEEEESAVSNASSQIHKHSIFFLSASLQFSFAQCLVAWWQQLEKQNTKVYFHCHTCCQHRANYLLLF